MNEVELKARIASRRRGREAFEMMLEDLSFEGGDPLVLEGFFRAAIAISQERLGEVPESRMDEQQAKVFEQEPVGFGRHGDSRWCDVEEGWVHWLAERSRRFLRWYESDRAQRRFGKE